MRRRDIKDLAKKSTEELQKQMLETRKLLFDMQMDFRMAKLKDMRSLFWKKKEIAYLLTQLQRKEKKNG